ncbi:MAG TPA: 6-carboxytetrahydropterin synthase [Burkholderiaceae bacterium]|jgi:6-pyruvoyltetrahydropterin/6-carboxytetrahydropterin synthase|nr:6-carboxytetrahydropterin synthase [Burkholderiaceae bacterium]
MPERLLFAAAAPFESARKLGLLPEGHCARWLHGHSFVASVRAAIAPGWAGFGGAEAGRLRECLERCVKPLDYQLLNDHLEQPTDENLARWVKAGLQMPGIDQVGIRSTLDQGVDLDRNERVHLWRRYRFEAAHRLPNVAPGHKCARMHGHGFQVVLHAEVAPRPGEAGFDHQRLDRSWAPLHAEFHQACLNDIPGLENPTSELIASAIWRRLKPALPQLSWVTVYETSTCGAHFDGGRYRIWTECSLDSAVRLKRAPDADPRRRVHGHTYLLRLHLNAPLDRVLGWTVDFGDVKELFRPVFVRLDHHSLHELPGIEDGDAASLARWIREQVASSLPQLDRIDVFETPGCGAILAWGSDEPALPV